MKFKKKQIKRWKRGVCGLKQTELTQFMEKQEKPKINYLEGFDWHNYNESQTKEKLYFINLLAELCSYTKETTHYVGRKPLSLKDLIFAVVIKQYLNISSRRIQSDLESLKKLGFISKSIPFNTLLDNLERYDLRESLKELIEISALPFIETESIFAIDATGFDIYRYRTYFNMKHGEDRKWRLYRKLHAVCGVKSNIISSVEITEGYVHDQNEFIPLINDTARNFNIKELCADKGYLNAKHFALLQELGGQAFIPFKNNTTGKSSDNHRSYFRQAFRRFNENKEAYMLHYHKRSNIESCFSMIKRKFGNSLKSKKSISQDNEILAKVLAHNICVLIQEAFLSGISLDISSRAENYIARQ